MKHRYTLLVSLGTWIGIIGFSLVNLEEDWGFFGHRRINRLAVFTLVPDMMPVFKKNIEFITEHAVDPDKRRYAIPGEAIRHYIDLDIWNQLTLNSLPKTYLMARATLGDWILKQADGKNESIFANPRFETFRGKKYVLFNQRDSPKIDFFEYQRFLSLVFTNRVDPEEEIWLSSDTLNGFFGRQILPAGKSLLWIDSFSRHGILPFYIPQLYLKLVHAFKFKDLKNILRLAADLGHYVGDAHVPLHTSSNYNGQLTGQTGLHAFWESRIPELFADQTYDYLLSKGKIWVPIAGLLLCLSIYILGHIEISNQNSWLSWTRSSGGHATHTAIALCGMVLSLIMFDSRFRLPASRHIRLAVVWAGFLFLAGFILRPYFHIGKIGATPSWGLYSAMFATIGFLILYWIIDIKKWVNWAKIFQPAGSNPLLTYIIPFILWALYDLFDFYPLPRAYKTGIIGLGFCVFYAFFVLWIVTLLNKLKIKLQL